MFIYFVDTESFRTKGPIEKINYSPKKKLKKKIMIKANNLFLLKTRNLRTKVQLKNEILIKIIIILVQFSKLHIYKNINFWFFSLAAEDHNSLKEDTCYFFLYCNIEGDFDSNRDLRYIFNNVSTKLIYIYFFLGRMH